MIEAIISEINANRQALEAVLADIDKRQVKKIICLGDILGYGGDPVFCLENVTSRTDLIVLGNQEAAICKMIPLNIFNDHTQKALKYQLELLTTEHILTLKKLPGMLQDAPYLFIHGSVMEQFGVMIESEDFRENQIVFRRKFPNYRFCVFANTHVPTCFTDGQLITPKIGAKISIQKGGFTGINPGSVGQPRGNLGNEARYALLDRENGWVEFIGVKYDISGAMQSIKDAELPRYLADRLQVGI